MKSSSKTKPIYDKQVMGAYDTLKGAYNQAAPGIQQSADQFQGLVGQSIDRYKNDPMTAAARTYNTDVLSGKYMNGNPYLDAMIDQTGRSVTDRVTASIGTRGLTGGSAHSGVLARQLADAEARLRYGDYDAERARMGQAVSQTGQVIGAENALLEPAFGAFDAQMAPLQAASGYANTVGGLLGQYTKTKQKQGLGSTLAGLAGAGLSGWASGGFG